MNTNNIKKKLFFKEIIKSFFKKIINWSFIFLWIFFLTWWITILVEWNYIYGLSLSLVWISFFPYIYNKINYFLKEKWFNKKIINNYWKLYFSTFFIIFLIWIILGNSWEYKKNLKDNSNILVSYSINKNITTKKNLVINLKQKYINEIILNNKPIIFKKNQENIKKTIPLHLWKNIILIEWKNKFFHKTISKTIVRLSEKEYKIYLDKIKQEKIKKEKERQEKIKELEQERLKKEKERQEKIEKEEQEKIKKELKKKEVENKKRMEILNWYKHIKITNTPKIKWLKFNFLNFNIGNTFIYDSYWREYYYSTAERWEKYITMKAYITSEGKNPILPVIAFYKYDNLKLHYIWLANYKFTKWKDYWSYLWNYHDNWNDFKYSKTVKFSIWWTINKDIIGKYPIFIVLTNKKCFTRNEDVFETPKISYQFNYDCQNKNVLSLYDLKNLNIIKIYNKNLIK